VLFNDALQIQSPKLVPGQYHLHFSKNCVIMTSRNLYFYERKYCCCTNIRQLLWSVPVIQIPNLQCTLSLQPAPPPPPCPPCFCFCVFIYLFIYIILFHLPAYSFKGSYSVLFKVTYHSCQTIAVSNILFLSATQPTTYSNH
jgi:hypothetical protein